MFGSRALRGRLIVLTRALRSKVRARVEESFLRGSLRGPTPAAPSGMARVAGLDGPSAPQHGPVAPQARQDAGERRQAAPAGGPLVGGAAAGVVRAGHVAVVVRIVVEEGFDAAQTRRVIHDGIRAEVAGFPANPALGECPGNLAVVAPGYKKKRSRHCSRGIARQMHGFLS